MSAYTSFISDVHKSYRVEKLALHRLIFLLIKIKKCSHPFSILEPFICSCDKIAFGSNKHLLIMISKNIR